MTDNLYGRFRHRFLPHLARPFLESEDGRLYTYAKLEQTSGRYARRLHALGLCPGDRLVAQIDKTPGAVFLYLACLRAGIIYVPLNTAYQAAEVAYLVADSAPKAVICRPSAHAVMAAAAAPQGIRQVLTLDAADGGTFAEGSEGLDPDYPEAAVTVNDVAALLYTSGTTGHPKGAMMTHGHLWDKADALTRLWGWGPTDVLLHSMPIFHTHGLFLSMHCVLASGAGMLFQPRFDADETVRLLPRCTVFTGAPTMYTRMLASPALDAEASRNMRLFISGSAPLAPQTFQVFRERTGHAILECWGMTETLSNASNPLWGERRPGSVGPPVPGVELRVTDGQGRAQPRGEAGVLEVRTARMFAGYWEQPEATRAAFRPDGFFITGDLGRVDDDGVVTIVGRANDLIISGGYNVYPKEVESVLARIDGVADSAVVGIPHADFGEGVVAVVERQPGRGALTEAGILDRLKGELANFKVPKRVLFVDALPRNAVGKVQKQALRERYQDAFRPPR
jgi:malonyl-CoA/methylmalonyl-CoA synthetase